MLSVRVRDESVRGLMTEIKRYASDAAICATQEEGEQAMMGMIAVFETLNQRIGEILRQLDD